VAASVAARLGILHLDTGAMYRAFAWEALRLGIDSLDEAALGKLTEDTRIGIEFGSAGQQTLVNGKDVTEFIRTQEISMAASNASKFAGVRRFMVRMQQELAKQRSMVLDGRDIGLRVLPGATIKVFLTASPEVRAQRRFLELKAKDETVTYEAVLADVRGRDLQDSTREIDPLAPAEGAVVVDTSHMTQEEAVEAILSLLRERQENGAESGGEAAPAAQVQTPSAPKRLSRKDDPRRFSWSYRAASILSWFVFTFLCPVKYHHVEKAQLDAPFILIANHNSMVDPLVAGWKCFRFQIRFMGKRELVQNPILNALFKNMRMIPVDRYHMDMAAVRACIKALGDGHPLGIFPEGTRHKQGVMQEMESGVAMIALRGNAPLLPAYITGKPGFFRRVHCYYADPIPVDGLVAGGSSKGNAEALLAMIRQAYEGLVAEHERRFAL
jgi:cytidylate kinase